MFDRTMKVLLIVVLSLCVWTIGVGFIPSEHWMTVSKLYVSDAVEGESPTVHIDRVVKQPFVLHWHDTVRKFQDDTHGTAISVCWAEGTTSDYPGRLFPERDFNIKYVMRPGACELNAGAYYLEIIWSWNALGAERTVTLTSNVFKVTPGSTNLFLTVPLPDEGLSLEPK